MKENNIQIKHRLQMHVNLYISMKKKEGQQGKDNETKHTTFGKKKTTVVIANINARLCMFHY